MLRYAHIVDDNRYDDDEPQGGGGGGDVRRASTIFQYSPRVALFSVVLVFYDAHTYSTPAPH